VLAAVPSLSLNDLQAYEEWKRLRAVTKEHRAGARKLPAAKSKKAAKKRARAKKV
jgi:hypothetical protein